MARLGPYPACSPGPLAATRGFINSISTGCIGRYSAVWSSGRGRSKSKSCSQPLRPEAAMSELQYSSLLCRQGLECRQQRSCEGTPCFTLDRGAAHLSPLRARCRLQATVRDDRYTEVSCSGLDSTSRTWPDMATVSLACPVQPSAQTLTLCSGSTDSHQLSSRGRSRCEHFVTHVVLRVQCLQLRSGL